MFKLIIKICLLGLMPSIPAFAHATGESYGTLIWVLAFCSVFLLILSLFFLSKLKSIRMESRQGRMTDSETGIGNRADFARRFENDISDFTRTNYCVAYFVVDSNYLQAYHKDAEFSSVVKQMAEVLTDSIKNYEFAARVTESGFAMAFKSEGEESATERVESVIDTLNRYIDPRNETPHGTFKAAIYNLESEDRNCEMLLFNLRRQCNLILGSDRQVVYCDSAGMNSILLEKELVERIRQGLSRQEFKLYIQFIVDNKTKQIVSGEALSRWENPETGIQLPGKYIGAMMNSGLITDFDYYMFEQVCSQLEKWADTELGHLSISCNFTRITISEDSFVDKIKEISEKYSFDKSKLVMEITEETKEKNRKIALSNMRECKKMGFKIALDDFGCGYTSPINLCEYPLDIVKIDREVLLKTEEAKGSDLFKGLIALAHSLNLKVVCEGVETEKQHSYVHNTLCDHIQGWYFSKAIPSLAGESFMKEYLQRG